MPFTICKCGELPFYYVYRENEEMPEYLCRRCYDYAKDVRQEKFVVTKLTKFGREKMAYVK